MSADRELLELAAKAIGMTLQYNYLGGRDANQPWNPLTDDGDALRLAVALSIGVRPKGPTCWNDPNTTVALFDRGENDSGRITVPNGDDARKATRRAIVLAAAEIGRRMP